MPITTFRKAVAHHAAAALGGTPVVHEYHHELEELSVDIMRCGDCPVSGVTSYSTVGLSDHAMRVQTGEVFPTRLELAAACSANTEQFAAVLAAIAFCIMRDGSVFCPGTALPKYIGEFVGETTVPHAYLTSPFLWEGSLGAVTIESVTVAWCLVVPISDGELEYLRVYGDEALENQLEAANIDVFDLQRSSVA